MKHLKLIVAFIAILSFFPSKAQFEFQTCVVDSADYNNSWKWPGHKKWFIGDGPVTWSEPGIILNFDGGGFTKTTLFSDSCCSSNAPFYGIPVYEGITSASDDNGDLVVFSNGRFAWDATGKEVSNDIKEGNEGGFNKVGSASQGILSVRHPLVPEKYYLVTTSDVIGAGPNVSYNTFDNSGVEIGGNTELPGSFISAEGIAASFHANGIDIWITILQRSSPNFHSWLLTCDGFKDDPVISPVANPVTGDPARGGIAFSHDGKKLAAVFGGSGTVRNTVFDFNNLTGEISNRQNVGTVLGYDVVWTKDNQNLLIGGIGLGNFIVDATTGSSTKIIGPSDAHHSVEIGGDGNYYLNGLDGLWKWSGSGNAVKVDGSTGQGLPTMYIPPAEEPDIQEVGHFCDTVNIILPDLHTNWICNGLSAEDTIGGKPIVEQRHRYFILDSLDETQENLRSSIIIDEKTGVFNPKEAGPGFHKVVFEFCDVNDTIEIEVRFCPACRAETQDITPKFCAGNDYLLDTLVTDASRQGVWTIDSFPSSSGKDAEIKDGVSDTLFDATDLTTKWGTYKVLFSVTDAGETCYDSVYVIVDSIPNPILTGDTICDGDGPVTFDPGTFHTYEWGPDNETSTTITKNATATISVEVTTSEGCIWSDTVEFLVNPLPEPFIENETICDGDTLIIFDAGNYASYDWSTGDTTQTIQPDSSADYNIEVTDTNGCKKDTSFNYTIHPKPVVNLGLDSAICADDSAVTFDAGNPGSNYNWSNGEKTQTITTKITDEYTVIIVDANTCSDTDTVVLTVNAMPIVDLGPDSSICEIEDSVVFDAGNTTARYLWSNADTTQYIKTKIQDEYSVVVTDTNGCIGYDTVSLTVSPMPAVNITDQEICIGDSAVTFDVGAVYKTYEWDNNSLDTNKTLTTDSPGEHTVVFTDTNGCVGNDTAILSVHPLPTPDLGKNDTICADSMVTFDAGNYDKYIWSPGGDTSQTIIGDSSGYYTVEVTDTNSCKQKDTVQLLVIELPTPDILKDETKCPNSDHTFDIKPYDNGNGPYTYLWKSGSTGSTYTTSNPDTVWVNVTDKYGCLGIDTGSVIDSADLKVIITASPSVDLCFGDSAELVSNFKASNGYSFKWKWPNNDSTTTEKITVKESGIYDLDVELNSGGCRGDSSIEIFVHPLPVPFIKGDTICQSETAVTFDAGVYDKYIWSPGGETSRKITPNVSGDYTVEVTDSNGCKEDTTFNYLINLNPVPKLLNDTACAGDTITLKDLSGQNNAYQLWSNNGDTTISTKITTSGTYTLTVTSSDTCHGQATSEVYFIPIPTIDLGPDINLCEGESATIDAKNPGLNVSWNTSESTQTINVSKSGTYIANVSDNGCLIKDEVIVNVAPYPISKLDQSLALEPICFEEDGTIITLDAGENIAYDYLWSTEDTTSNIDINKEGTYIVKISVGNCSITDDISFKAYCPSSIFVPNAFTPDQDLINDYFNAKGNNIEDYQMFIYDRWGELIFHSESLEDHWDGTYKNRKCQIDVYVWRIYYSVESLENSNYRIKKQKTGRVSLLR